ncbi:MAG: hypothetical protein A3A96_04315 [Candidatus Zambryskibacteria bacterium RIFCSPLOWO2_01_FULL_39_39]|uniref:Uncharacterized protein n=1 Tax=Candidatus Zambryskibacteria bacterium RIFCSPLOWO2_01_FULL_39_39 TaxID=1802758 RepID=A0A1G2TWY7_9BACT|nr:MAG: hypothetical protein A2644_03940 [Candidatus Zambryskibacteria bacterium RIFCSPHIGHO2_01_FULL_39_63]OHA95323.1 MAG: hypothetical protein A3B88_02480 [Candidatus Zambryskibacteria bacterium RIFCSPHIGHO2_02_FULL_39_19]OHA98901.1 MAG: hypothetical protein A3F20_02575 [Candidatus Zambryskibacteria bacterium RIFCSPHIGHO2_12_FULL_39_21]OHB01754.1 MAG: hypothetical protein A3A96_04315 [Candidatus Zambryskibacteria bacterium RIFCSPLOWO2_01_FULL_39_39]
MFEKVRNFLVRPKQNCEGGGARREVPRMEEKGFLGLFCRGDRGSIRRFSGEMILLEVINVKSD